jgi:hypothetical protein
MACIQQYFRCVQSALIIINIEWIFPENRDFDYQDSRFCFCAETGQVPNQTITRGVFGMPH